MISYYWFKFSTSFLPNNNNMKFVIKILWKYRVRINLLFSHETIPPFVPTPNTQTLSQTNTQKEEEK